MIHHKGLARAWPATQEDMNHGWTRINTDHQCISVSIRGSLFLILQRVPLATSRGKVSRTVRLCGSA